MEKTLCLIDSGLTSLHNAGLHDGLEHINVHCNTLRRIEGLERLVHLVSLDLSANNIAEIAGLDSLRDLRVLNLSCNCISAIQGLEYLRSGKISPCRVIVTYPHHV